MAEARYTLVTPSAQALAEAAPIESGAVRAYRIHSGDGATVVCIAIDEGAELVKHTAGVPILIQTVSGEVIVRIDDSEEALPLGAVVHIDAKVPHSVRAVTPARILLTLLSGADGAEPVLPGPVRAALPLTDVSADAASRHSQDGHADCTCGEADEPLPELDVRTIPHAIRHATVFGALDGLGAGAGMVLVAHHDPLPLLAQIERRYDGAIDVAYGERGPEVWKLQLTRAR